MTQNSQHDTTKIDSRATAISLQQSQRYTDWQMVTVTRRIDRLEYLQHCNEDHNSKVRIYAHMSVLLGGLAIATIFVALPPVALAIISAGPAILIELVDRKLHL